MLDEIARLHPSEIIVPELPSGRPHEIGDRIAAMGIKAVTARPGWQFTLHHAREQIQRQWQGKTAGGFGFSGDGPAGFAPAARLSYPAETQQTRLPHLRPLRPHGGEEHLSIPPARLRSLGIAP